MKTLNKKTKALTQHKDDSKLTSMLRFISIFATTISTYQIASLGLGNAPTLHIEALNFDLNMLSLVSIPFGVIFGIRLENSFKSNTQKLSELSGKSYIQDNKIKDLRGARAGFIMALALNIATFTGGVYFSVYTAVQIHNHFNGAANPATYYIELKKGNEERMKICNNELKPNAIKDYVSEHKGMSTSNNKAIEATYSGLIAKATSLQADKIKELKKWQSVTKSTKVRASHKQEDLNWIDKQYKAKREKILRPLKNIKAEYQNVLSRASSKPIDLLQLEKDHKAELQKDISKLTITNDALDTKIEAIKAKDKKDYNGLSWAYSFYIAIGFYFLQWLANIAEQRSGAKVMRMEKSETVNDKNFDLNEFAFTQPQQEPLQRTFNQEVNDDDFLDYIADEFLETGRVPNTQIISRDLNKSSRDITNIFQRNNHYFTRANGKSTEPTDAFLNDYNLGYSVAV
jgi:hypothetical protein